MGRRRKKDRHLPPRVYPRRGKLYYVEPGSEKWIPLPEGLRTWAKLVEASEPATTLSILWAKYDLEVLSKKAKKTQQNRRQEWSALEPVFGPMRPEDVEPHHVWKYFRERGEGEGARHEVRCLSALMTYARQVGAIKHENPCFGLQLPSGGPRDRYVTDKEFLAVRDLAVKVMKWPMVAHAMNLSLLCGMSQIDVLTLTPRQLIEEGILFDRQKTGQAQLVEWNNQDGTPNEDLIAEIEAIFAEEPHVSRKASKVVALHAKPLPLICRRNGKPFTSSGFQTLWQRLMVLAVEGEKNPDGTWQVEPVIKERFTYHDIRAKSLSDAKSLAEAQARGGHADSRITQRVYRRLPKRAPALDVVGTQLHFGGRSK
jgi:integrase